MLCGILQFDRNNQLLKIYCQTKFCFKYKIQDNMCRPILFQRQCIARLFQKFHCNSKQHQRRNLSFETANHSNYSVLYLGCDQIH